MQSVLVYGRTVARALFSGLTNEIHHQSGSWQTTRNASYFRPEPNQLSSLQLVTALSGFSKSSQSTAQILRKWSFGDDACFVASQKLADVIGVADGVGGWRNYGIDPSQFPRSLMSTCERLVKEGHFNPTRPSDMLSAGYYEVLENKTALLGSCTACVVSLYHEDKTLYSANLGDSGFRVIRKGAVVHRSQEQQHYFNTPFQLSVAPSTLQGLVLSDSPSSAVTSSFAVEEGDVVLVGTDGLFDNLNDDMILQHIARLKDTKIESIQNIANAIAKHANQLAFDPDYMSPFSMHAGNYGYNIKGGKPDDVTVILGRVTRGLL